MMHVFLVLLLGCGGTAEEVPDDCVNGTPCDPGQVCLEGTCRIADCTASNICPFGQYCDLDQFTCVDGCQTDDDCLAEDRCESGSCETRQCIETQRDCPLLSFCDEGSCEAVDTRDWCGPCASNDDCSAGFACVTFDDSPGGSWCVTNCEDSAECPSGLTCLELDFTTEVRSVCYTDCQLLYENGLIE